MDPTTAEVPPGCLIVLIAQSAAMADDARVRLAHREIDGEPDIRELPKGFAARFLADELLEGLAGALAAGYPVPLDVAVIGYSSGDDGTLSLTSLLPDGKPRVQLLPLADVVGFAVEARSREGDPRKWTTAAEYSGSAPAAVALAEVYRLVSVWLTGRYHARPPVVIHCTSGEDLGDDYSFVARSLVLLATAYGPTRLLHVGLTSEFDPMLCGQWPEPVHEQWVALLDLSAELPAEPEGRQARRAVSVNDWSITDAWSALFDLTPLAEFAWSEPDGGRFSPTLRELWTQKMGNAPEEWEDAFATDPINGVAVVADGASSGIYCRLWADRLAERFVADRPDARDAVALGKWVHELRAEWRTAIDYPALSWTKQRKVDETGAAATLLGLEVGPLDADGNRSWRACSVGDASLFWVRDGKLHATFPIVALEQFGSVPMLVRSNPGFKTVVLAAASACRPGDRFLLATDAVAARLFKSLAIGPGPDWLAFETIDADAWRKDLDSLRKTNEMVNDDCTLVVLRIMGSEPEPAAGEKNEPNYIPD